MEQKLKHFGKIYVWFITGILLCIAVSLMRMGGSIDPQQFLANGDIYEFSQEDLTSSTAHCVYDSNTKLYTVNGNLAYKTFRKLSENHAWPYLYLKISNLNIAYSYWKIEYYDKDKNKVGEQTAGIVNGDNMIPVQYNDKFRWIKIGIENQPDLVFTLDKIQLRDSGIFLNIPDVAYHAFAYFVAYLLISLVVWLLLKGQMYHLVEMLQYVFILTGNYAGSRIGGRLCEKARNCWRTILFCSLFLFMTVWGILGFYDREDMYKYGILVCALLILLLGFLSWERPLHYIRWNGMFPAAWLALWSMVCVSDFMVSKFYKFTGYVCLLAVGFFFFVWNNMERPVSIRSNLLRGLEWTFPLVTVYCMLFRQKRIGVLYNGPFQNREWMSFYAVIILVAFLAEIYRCLLVEEIRHRKKKLILFGIAAALGVYYLYESYTVICILAAIAAVVLWVIMLLQRRCYLVYGMGKSAGILLAALICSVAVVLPVHAAIKNLPEHLGMNLIYVNEKLETHLDNETIAAASLTDPTLFQGVESASAVSLEKIWQKYLGKMNLFGHDGVLRVARVKEMASNGMLEMTYRYGIFIFVPYSLLLLFSFSKAWKEKEYFMMATVLVFFIVMLAQNIELPFATPLWMVFYLGMGNWFLPEKELAGGNRV